MSLMHRNLTERLFLWLFADAGISEVDQLRLVNSPSYCAGRVEVLHNQKWGTVCDDSWDLQDAGVVCRQLGCGTALLAPGGARFGQGSDRIWLDDVNCTGTEAALSDCRARPWGDNNCNHREDAGVVCSGNWHPSRHSGWCRDGAGKLSGETQIRWRKEYIICNDRFQSSSCSVQRLDRGATFPSDTRDQLHRSLPQRFFPWVFADAGISEVAQIQLVNGPSRCAGRVEVLHNQKWGTVCDDSWDLQDAGVVCRQLGCGTALSAPRGARFGPGSDRILLDYVNCTGTEVALSDCRARPWGDNNCTHGEDAGVVCSDAGISEVAQLRLVNGPSGCAGRVEMLHNQLWGTVCDDSWDLQDAGVVCRQLGCGTALSAPGGARFGHGSDRIWLADINCTGTEVVLSDCRAWPWGENNCTHREDAGVVCSVAQLRLVNGPSHCAGRVEVLHNQKWGTVCDDSWDIQDAGVVCRQLGCGTALSAPGGARFGHGSHHIWLADINCTGTEVALSDCRAWGENNCTHEQDAGVVCSVAQLRLVNSPSRCAGRVEVLHNHRWGTVCDDNWDLQDAGVVCRQLGCGTALSAPGGARFGRGSDRIWLDNVNCTGTEVALSDCRARPWGENNCTDGEDAGVVCSGNLRCNSSSLPSLFPWLFADAGISEVVQLRLVNSPSRCAGRVEVLHSQKWGTVCDDSWDLQDAGVVCRQLGCGTALSAPRRARFGQGSDRIWLDDVNCTGTEAALSDCRARPWGDNNCNHREDAGVVCSEVAQLQLVNGPSRCAGRVEVLHNQQWGTVCDDGWDLQDAGVVCRQLGCGTALSAPRGARFGPGSDRIWLADINCTGTEVALSDCRALSWGENNYAGISEVAQLRLVNGPSHCAGRVEVLHNRQWGTVCDDSWDLQDAGVVCRQLGCGTALSAPGGARFGQGSDRIWLDNMNCTGTEVALSDCRARPWGENNCTHREDAGVVCSGNLIWVAATQKLSWGIVATSLAALFVAVFAKERGVIVSGMCLDFYYNHFGWFLDCFQ
uniref:Soluble scavenger receptor cysteine-rich domain-containing protein SSC5D n=1 Tax=Chrysemys picta bellii TaxID=8478 RepID=A0A8C3H9T4_CHRPI